MYILNLYISVNLFSDSIQQHKTLYKLKFIENYII